MTLRTRLTVTVAAVVALAIAGGAYAAHYDTSRELRAETDRFLLTRSARLVRAVEGFPIRPVVPVPVPPPGSVVAAGVAEGVLGLDAVTQTIRPDGSVLRGLNDQPDIPVDGQDVAIATGDERIRLRDASVGGVRYRVLTAPLAGGGAVQIARSEAETDAVLAVLRLRLVLLAAAGAAIAAGVAWLVARRATGPIQRVTEASERVASTQELVPIEVHGSDEVARLATSFNTMLVALGTSREQQQRLVVDASHELRTPLTAVRTNVDFLRRAGETLEPDERRKLLDETALELNELTNLVVELVELATTVRSEEPVEGIDLGELAADVVGRFRRRTGRTITLTAPHAVAVDGRRSMLDRALSNLVDNALKFSPGPEPVEILVASGRVEVADRGPGIDSEDRPRVFDRFYRATAARSLPGSGLGLAIVKQVVELHGGTVAMVSRPGGGTVARMVLPVSGSGKQTAAAVSPNGVRLPVSRP